jgi:hypothetical protein
MRWNGGGNWRWHDAWSCRDAPPGTGWTARCLVQASIILPCIFLPPQPATPPHARTPAARSPAKSLAKPLARSLAKFLAKPLAHAWPRAPHCGHAQGPIWTDTFSF